MRQNTRNCVKHISQSAIPHKLYCLIITSTSANRLITVKQCSACGVELIRPGLLLGRRGARSHSSQLDVIRLKLRRCAKVDLELIQTLSKALNTRLNRRFALLVLLHHRRRRFVSAYRLVYLRNAARDTTEQVGKPRQMFDLIGDALGPLRTHLRYALSGRGCRGFGRGRSASRLAERCRGR